MSAKAELVQMDVQTYMKDVGQRARVAARDIGKADTGVKNTALHAIADHIDAQAETLKQENSKDLEAGQWSG